MTPRDRGAGLVVGTVVGLPVELVVREFGTRRTVVVRQVDQERQLGVVVADDVGDAPLRQCTQRRECVEGCGKPDDGVPILWGAAPLDDARSPSAASAKRLR